MNSSPHIFKTKRLILRPTNELDAKFIQVLFNTPKWLQFIGDRNVRTEEDAKIYIRERMNPQLETLGYSTYTVVRKSNNTKLGTCGLYDREGLDGIDIGFAFLPEHEGRGYAYESTRRLLDAAMCEFGLNEVLAITMEMNTDSIRLLEKLGLSLSEKITLAQDQEELLLYKIQKG